MSKITLSIQTDLKAQVGREFREIRFEQLQLARRNTR